MTEMAEAMKEVKFRNLRLSLNLLNKLFGS